MDKLNRLNSLKMIIIIFRDCKDSNFLLWCIFDGFKLLILLKCRTFRHISILVRKIRKPDDKTFAFPAIQIPDAKREQGMIAVLAASSLRVKVKRSAHTSRIDFSEISKAKAGKNYAAAYRYFRHPFDLVLDVSMIEPRVFAQQKKRIAFTENLIDFTSDIFYDIKDAGVFRFLANMSHEIRTPMNAILGFSEILKEKISDKQHGQYLSMIRASGKLLLTLINDILDLSKIEAGKMQLAYKAVNPYSIFKEITNILSQKIEEKRLKFILETDLNPSAYLLLDEARLRQIILNLMGNAIKFTESGTIKLTTKTKIHDLTSDTVDFIFSVEDTGIGIPAEQKKTIFDAFEQQSGQDQAKYGGTGLGLAITKRLTEMMGGTIAVSGEKGQGSVFTVTLPNVQQVKSPDILKKKNKTPVDSIIFDKTIIMIVDDITSNRDLLRGYLQDYNFEFIEAKDGQEACDLAKQHHPNLILMDLKMPVMDGYKATQNIKECLETKDIPIIAITASVMKNSGKDIRCLCDGYLKKPLKKDALVVVLARFLKYSIIKLVPDMSGTSPLDEKNNCASYEPDYETRKKIPELVQILETQFMKQWEEFNEILIMDDVGQFANDLIQFGRDYNFPPITDYSELLADCVEIFDVVEMKKKMAEFPDFIKRVKSMGDQLTCD
ncbi:ATP-binding protein [Desulfococcaceae bacterium HSG9]|nr:ATP-binding protein [Desulfococcaceae bacterium HSG9]